MKTLFFDAQHEMKHIMSKKKPQTMRTKMEVLVGVETNIRTTAAIP